MTTDPGLVLCGDLADHNFLLSIIDGDVDDGKLQVRIAWKIGGKESDDGSMPSQQFTNRFVLFRLRRQNLGAQ